MLSNSFATGKIYSGVCVELSARLCEIGWQVTTASSLSSRILRPIDMFVTAWRAHNRYSVAQIDVFSGAAFRWAELSVFLLKLLHKPIILTLHGGNLPGFSQHNENRMKKLLNSADHVTAPSPYLLDKLKVYRFDIQLLPNPIVISKYPYRARTSPSPRILYLRALHRIYNPLLAVQTLEVLRANGIEVSLAMVGPDKGDGTLEELQKLISDLGVVDQVSLIGAIPKTEVPIRMSEYDIFINTTNVDNTPVSVIEAMACGLCVVSTNVGGIPYLLTHEHDALLVPPNDPDAMAVAVRRILTEPGLAERLSRNARKKAETFDWSVILPQWEQLLAQVIDEH